MKFEISYSLSKEDLVLWKIFILNGNCQQQKKKKERKKRKVKIKKYRTKNKNLQWINNSYNRCHLRWLVSTIFRSQLWWLVSTIFSERLCWLVRWLLFVYMFLWWVLFCACNMILHWVLSVDFYSHNLHYHDKNILVAYVVPV